MNPLHREHRAVPCSSFSAKPSIIAMVDLPVEGFIYWEAQDTFPNILTRQIPASGRNKNKDIY
jgi:hypothetical protein